MATGKNSMQEGNRWRPIWQRFNLRIDYRPLMVLALYHLAVSHSLLVSGHLPGEIIHADWSDR